MSSEFNEKNYSSKMDKSIQSLKKDLSTLRTGRANPNMLDTIKIDVYGQIMPIDQLATITVPEAETVHPMQSVAVTVYVPAVAFERSSVVSPVLQAYV